MCRRRLMRLLLINFMLIMAVCYAHGFALNPTFQQGAAGWNSVATIHVAIGSGNSPVLTNAETADRSYLPLFLGAFALLLVACRKHRRS